MYVPIEMFLSVVLIILIYSMWHVTNRGEKSTISRFIAKFSIIGSIFVPIGIYLTYKVFSLQLQSMKRDATYKIIDRSWLNINKIFIDYYKHCPKFISTLYYKWQKDVLGKELDHTHEDKWEAVNYVSISIFQAWEDFITSSDIDETSEIIWLNKFIQWAESPVLHKNWRILKTNYAETTQKFGDYLFYITENNVVNNEKELHNLAENFVHSNIFQNILQERFK